MVILLKSSMKYLIVLSILIVGLFAFAACGNNNDDVDEITIWAWDPNFNIHALNIGAEFFAEVSDVNVNIVEDAQDSIIQRLNTIFAGGTMVGLPNIVLIEDYRAQVFLQAFPGMFYDLSAYVNPSQFAPYKIPFTSFEGRQYGVPFDTGVTGMYVRTDLLEQSGLTLDDVTNITWQELLEIGQIVYNATGVRTMNFDPDDMAGIRIMIQSAGVWYTGADGVTPNLNNSPAIAQAFSVIRSASEAGLTVPNNDWGSFLRTFNDGDVWMVVTGNWITPSVMAESSQFGDWAVVPTPRLDLPGAVNASNLGGSSWYVINMDGKEAAAQFLQTTFAGSVPFYEQLLYEIGAIGTFIPALDSDYFDREFEFFSGQTILSDFARWSQDIPQVNFGLHTYAIDEILSIALQGYMRGEDLQTVLDNAQAMAETQLRQ